ncbi:MAG TPA: DUF6569 family protein [Candidatus Acidoferrum sp.]|nr:DUF6569 family protein [Candidatus Acidoferrum sp.]
MWTLQEEFARIEIGQASQIRNLKLFPLIRRNASQPLDYLLLEDGIAQGKVRVTELSGGGSVPELSITNTAELPVLLVDGEELVGAKQNRVLNLSILVPAKHTMAIPVSCFEAGRWCSASVDLKTASHMMYSGARGPRTSQVTRSMRSSGSRSSDQRAVWEELAAKAARLKTASPTQAMSALYDQHARGVEEFVRGFNCQKEQCGVAFAISGRVLGLDLFDSAEVMNKFFEKLVRSYALDALDAAQEGQGRASTEELSMFVGGIGAAPCFSDGAVGLGKDVRFTGSGVSGAALWAQGRYLHVCAFAKESGSAEKPGFWTRLTRPSRRHVN